MATGGYVTAASWHRSALYEIAETRGVGNYSADEMNRMFGASCPDIVTHALGLLFQEFAARSLPSVRADQQRRLRNSTCASDGMASAAALPHTSRLNPGHFGGLYLLLLISVSVGVFFSDPMQAYLTDQLTRLRSVMQYYAGKPQHQIGILKPVMSRSSLSKINKSGVELVTGVTEAALDAIAFGDDEYDEEERVSHRAWLKHAERVLAKLTEPPPTTMEWREEVDGRLGKLELMLERVLERLQPTAAPPAGELPHTHEGGLEALQPKIAPSAHVQTPLETCTSPAPRDCSAPSAIKETGRASRPRLEIWRQTKPSPVA